MILQLRVDQRLIHGQVTQGWAHQLRFTHIVVVSEAIRHDLRRQRILRLGVPEGIEVSFLTPAETHERWQQLSDSDQRVLLLTDDLRQVVELFRLHGSLPQVVLGNIHARENCRSLAPTIYCTEEELKELQELLDHNVRIETCSGAGDRPVRLPDTVWRG